ncbi:MAG: hypothetical protein H6719_28140 [Sandaracinaceae bacterium]|nr:hypothetical protein [Sandaracinaceae bacterium]
MAKAEKAARRDRPRWKLDPSEVPAELRGNLIVEYLVHLSPEEEADIAAAEELDAVEAAGPRPR